MRRSVERESNLGYHKLKQKENFVCYQNKRYQKQFKIYVNALKSTERHRNQHVQ